MATVSRIRRASRRWSTETRKLPSYRGQPIVFNEDDHFDFSKP